MDPSERAPPHAAAYKADKDSQAPQDRAGDKGLRPVRMLMKLKTCRHSISFSRHLISSCLGRSPCLGGEVFQPPRQGETQRHREAQHQATNACASASVIDSTRAIISRSIVAARAAIVGASKTARRGRSIPKAVRIFVSNCAPSNEWPPSRKKLSLIPTSFTLNSSQRISARRFSIDVPGGTKRWSAS